VSNSNSEACEFVGDGQDDAINKACQHFGVDDASALEISGFEPGAVYGLATRTVIVAIPKGATRPPPSRSRDDEGGGDSGRGAGRDSGRDRGRGEQGRGGRGERGRGGRGEQGRESSASPREEREPRGNRGGRDAGRDGGGDGGGEGREPREDRGSRDDGESRGERESAPTPKATDSKPTNEASVGSAKGKLGEIGQFLLGTIERMGLGSFEIAESEEAEMIVLQVKGTAAEALSSGQGRTVDALQLLVNQVSARVSEERQRVVVDVEGDADAREEFLAKLAERVAKRALQTGRAVALDPMNGRDRRLIHVALRDRNDVVTISEGEGRYRQVVVIPESSDEFEDAREQSEQTNADG
jgi:spoIIIJ-associated protein